MKKCLFLTIALLIACSLSSSAIAKEKTKYEVRISVIYNALDAASAAEKVEAALRKHKGACKVRAQIRKVDILQLHREDTIQLHRGDTTDVMD